MALKRLLRPTNRRVRYLVGALLAALFCIQCIPAGETDSGSVLIAKDQPVEPADISQRVVDLAKSDHLALLNLCKSHYADTVSDYTCTLVKQERIGGALKPEQEIQVKFLDQPFSVAMNWTKNSPIGDRILYVEGRHDDKMIVRPKSGILQMLTGGSVRRKPDGADAMRNTLRPVNLFGFNRGMRELIAVYEAAEQAGELDQRFGGFAEVAGRPTVVLERYLPPREDYPAAKTLIYIDREHLVPICIEGYDWDDRLTCRYLYKDVQFNVGLTEDDFLPEAVGIKVPKK